MNNSLLPAAKGVRDAPEGEYVLGHSNSQHPGEEAPPMCRILETDLPREHFDVFEVTQITRGTPLESVVAADLVSVAPGRASEVHRHNEAETVLLILDGSGTVLVGESSLRVSKGARVVIGKGVFHGVRTEGESLTFLSVQSPPILVKARGTLDLEPLKSGQ
jgi:mannose-6-phosphate isomerase-like protein (cupin superfamily)